MTFAVYVAISATFIWFLRARPSAAAFVWIAIMVMVPPWYGLRVVGLSVPLALVLVGLTLVFGRGLLRTVSWSPVDLIVLALGTSLVIALLADSPVYLAWQGVSYWLAAYLAGRLLCATGVPTALGLLPGFATLVAVAAMAQALVGYDLASWLPGGDVGSSWIGLQTRDGLPRAELTMGHSIALAGFLTIAVPYVLMSGRSLWVRGSQLAVIFGGVWATASRAGLIAFVVAVAAYALTRRSLHPAWRVLNFLVLVIAAIAAFQPAREAVGQQLDSAADQGPSARYRLQLLDSFQFVRFIGLGDNAALNSDGVTFVWNGMVSVDNTPLYVGLNLGLAAAVFFVLPSIAAVYWAVRRGDSPAALAVVGQIVILATAAPITQYQSIYWFVVGMMVTECRQRPHAPTRATGRSRSAPIPSELQPAQQPSSPRDARGVSQRAGARGRAARPSRS